MGDEIQVNIHMTAVMYHHALEDVPIEFIVILRPVCDLVHRRKNVLKHFFLLIDGSDLCYSAFDLVAALEDLSFTFLPLFQKLVFPDGVVRVQVDEPFLFQLGFRDLPFQCQSIDTICIRLQHLIDGGFQVIDDVCFLQFETLRHQIHNVQGILIANGVGRTALDIARCILMPFAFSGCFEAPPRLVSAAVAAGAVAGDIAPAALPALDLAGKAIAVRVLGFIHLRLRTVVEDAPCRFKHLP